MVPAEFITFFVTCAQAAAALVGLLFVAVSIAPETTVTAGAPAERRAVAASAFTALTCAFFISAFAQIPHVNLGFASVVIGLSGIVNSFILIRILGIGGPQLLAFLRRLLVVIISVGLYAGIVWQGVMLIRHPADSGPLSTLDGLLLGIFGLGLIRAWELLGVRRYGLLSSWLNPLRDVSGHASDEP
jgi:hypothetical protein